MTAPRRRSPAVNGQDGDMTTDTAMHNTIRPATHSSRRCAIGLALLLTSGAFAEQSTLQANPGGTVSIEMPAIESTIQPATRAPFVGPPIGADDLTPEAESGSKPETTIEPIPEASKPLGAPAQANASDENGAASANTSDGGWGMQTVLALAAVIGLILLCKFGYTRVASRGGGSLAAQLGPAGRAPSGMLSVLARYPIAKGSTLVLLRLDRRVLLLSQTNQGFSTLAEITDPEEVAALIMRAEDEEGASLTRRFRTMLTQAERDPELIGEHEFEIESPAPMTPRAATARFSEVVTAMDPTLRPDTDDHADAVGSLRSRLANLREVTA